MIYEYGARCARMEDVNGGGLKASREAAEAVACGEARRRLERVAKFEATVVAEEG